MTPRDHALMAAAVEYHDAQRGASPTLALRATAAEMVRLLVGLAADDGATPEEAARALAVAFAGACKGIPTAALVARLRATATWLEQQDAATGRRAA